MQYGAEEQATVRLSTCTGTDVAVGVGSKFGGYGSDRWGSARTVFYFLNGYDIEETV